MKLLQYKISTTLYIIIIILTTMSVINIIPILSTILFPKLEKINKTITDKYNSFLLKYNLLGIDWIPYLILTSIFLFLSLTQDKSIVKKLIVSVLCMAALILPFFPLLNLSNLLLNIFIKNPPYIKDKASVFPSYQSIDKEYVNIKKEFEKYEKSHEDVDCFSKSNPNLYFEKKKEKDACWRTLYLKVTGKMVSGIEKDFPITSKLLKDPQIHNAVFSILDPGVEITPHVGYFRGYLRYHLGIIVPEIEHKKAYITVGGEKYEWSEGESVIFDDMYLHYVKNPTNMKRVVLFIDIKRSGMNPLLNSIVDVQTNLLENSLILKYFLKKQHTQAKLTD